MRPRREDRPREEAQAIVGGVIHVIVGGIAKGTESDPQTCKKQTCSVMQLQYQEKKPRREGPTPMITFLDKDFAGQDPDHQDPMVVTLSIGIFSVKRVLIDQGSSTDILYLDAYKGMGMKESFLYPFTGNLVGFAGISVHTLGIARSDVTVGSSPLTKKVPADFIVVSAPSAYNAIIGRPALNALKEVVSTSHLVMKFQVGEEVGELHADQKEARTCYAMSLDATKAVG